MKKALLSSFVMGLFFAMSSAFAAGSTLDKIYDGQVGECSIEASASTVKLIAMTLHEQFLSVEAALCREGKLIPDPVPGVRKYVISGITVEESYSDYEVIVTSSDQEPIDFKLQNFETVGRATLPLTESLKARGRSEVFVSAVKHIKASNGLEYSEGRVAWGSYILK